MDKYNIIIPTVDLDRLDADMNQWMLLPMDLKMRSNDDCMRIYGCTVTDLYNRLKASIIIKEPDIAPNAIKESMDLSNIDVETNKQLSDNLHTSEELQMTPYIVIIDPVDDLETVNQKYEKFCLLNHKYKLLSNDHSWQLWGFDVYNMYSYLTAKLRQTKTDDSEIKTLNIVSNFESCVESYKNELVHAYLYRDINKINSIKEELLLNESINIKDYIKDYIVDSLLDKSMNISLDEAVLPKVTPWFTLKEMHDKGIKCSITSNISYYKELRENMDLLKLKGEDKYKNNLLSLGWNPSIPLTEEAINYARKRQCEYLESENFIQYDFNNENRDLFLIFGDNGKVAISLSRNLDKLYEFIGINDSFKGFKKIYKDEYDFLQYKNIVVLEIKNSEDEYDRLKFNVLNSNIGKYNFNSVYTILTKPRNPFDPDCEKLKYAMYGNMIKLLSNINVETNELECIESFAFVYKQIYSGPVKEFK